MWLSLSSLLSGKEVLSRLLWLYGLGEWESLTSPLINTCEGKEKFSHSSFWRAYYRRTVFHLDSWKEASRSQLFYFRKVEMFQQLRVTWKLYDEAGVCLLITGVRRHQGARDAEGSETPSFLNMCCFIIPTHLKSSSHYIKWSSLMWFKERCNKFCVTFQVSLLLVYIGHPSITVTSPQKHNISISIYKGDVKFSI